MPTRGKFAALCCRAFGPKNFPGTLLPAYAL